MGQFNAKILAEYTPPRSWSLHRELSYTLTDVTVDEIDCLKAIGVQVVRDTNKTETISVPRGFVTDLASVPRAAWAFIAPWDVARSAIIHDLLYKAIRKYRWKNDKEDKELVKKAKKVADKVFLCGMNDARPAVPAWKKYSAYYAVVLFGRWSIIPNESNI